jgi:hypothetical protein
MLPALRQLRLSYKITREDGRPGRLERLVTRAPCVGTPLRDRGEATIEERRCRRRKRRSEQRSMSLSRPLRHTGGADGGRVGYHSRCFSVLPSGSFARCGPAPAEDAFRAVRAGVYRLCPDAFNRDVRNPWQGVTKKEPRQGDQACGHARAGLQVRARWDRNRSFFEIGAAVVVCLSSCSDPKTCLPAIWRGPTPPAAPTANSDHPPTRPA